MKCNSTVTWMYLVSLCPPMFTTVSERVSPATQSDNNISEDLLDEISALDLRNRSNPAQAKADAAAHRVVRTRCPLLQNELYSSHPKPRNSQSKTLKTPPSSITQTITQPAVHIQVVHMAAAKLVACHRYDPHARFKNWDSAFIAVSNRSVAFGSAAAKAFDRAHSAEPDKVEHVTQLEGCCPRAVAAHAGRKHILAVSFSGPPAIERFFAFEDMRTRDSFMEKLQV